MKFKVFYNTEGGGGGTAGTVEGTAGAGGTVETVDTGAGSGAAEGTPAGSENATSLFTQDATAEGSEQTKEGTEEGTAEGSDTNSNEPLDYKFSELEAYNGNEEYYNTLSDTFNTLGISAEQSMELVKLGDQILLPLIGKLNENSPEAIDARIREEETAMTDEERADFKEVGGILNSAFEGNEKAFKSFTDRFQDREGLAVLKTLIQHLKGGVNTASVNTSYESVRGTGNMNIDDFNNEYNAILAAGDISTIDAKKEKLFKKAKESGDNEVLELMKRYG